jgi:hypothetical protein
MSAVIAFEQAAVERLQDLARTDADETCAAGFVVPAGARGDRPRYLVRQLSPVPPSAYVSRGPGFACLSPSFCMDLANQARRDGYGVALTHTHPGPNALQSFSSVDDDGERALLEYFGRRIPDAFHVTAVFTQAGGRCRQLGSQAFAQLQVVGHELRWSAEHSNIAEPEQRFARQVLAFGASAQQSLSRLRVAIVGLGGTGSVVATELAHLGVCDYVLIDPDCVEETNLNRLVGATTHDLRRPKAKVFAGHIRSINSMAQCETVVGDVVDDEVAARLRTADFVFLCTDSHASRAVVNQIAYQYLIPTIDIGVAIHSRNGAVTDVVGRTQMLSSGLACLLCAGWIDSSQVRLEMMTDDERQRDAYTPGVPVAQPAVISLNSTIASAAVTMFLASAAAIPSEARMIFYDAIRGSMRPTLLAPRTGCIVCSSDGALARGATWSLPTRHHVPR